MSLWVDGFEPSFKDAAERCALRGGNADASTLERYFETRLLRLNPKPGGRLAASGEARVVTVDGETSHAFSRVHIIYLDVGCWAGKGGEDQWPRHREFGVAHGQLVLLCAFSQMPTQPTEPDPYAAYGNPQVWNHEASSLTSTALVDATIVHNPDWPKVQKLLFALAQAVPKSQLRILGATSLASIYVQEPPRGDDVPITIFLGDFHAPVATNSANAHIVENGRELLRGRLAMRTDELQGVPPLPGSDFAKLGFKAGQRTGEALQDLQWNAPTTHESVESWLRLYHGEGQRGADIFQDAGPDLRAFVDALQRFHENDHPLELVQLGDLFDLWLGFQHAFGDTRGGVGPLENLHEDALEFARFWVERTLFKTDQGPHLVHLLTLGQRAGRNRETGLRLRTKFLYGNHDDYLKHGGGTPIVVPAGLEHADSKIHAFGRRSFDARVGLWAEHGHQPDTYNHDEDPSSGYKLTQAAFFIPGVRKVEGPAGWVTTAPRGKYVPRLVSIEHAIRRCLHGQAKLPGSAFRGIYVMGHTHEAMLKRVELLPCPPREHRRSSGSGGD
jgi:hypothetical protein